MKKSRRIALLAFELALIVIFSLIPINLGVAVLALTLLPVLVIALTQDLKTAAAGGLIMGITSLVGAFTIGAANLTAPLFQNPLISVVPRIFVPVVAYLVDKGLVALAHAVNAKKENYSLEKGWQVVIDGVACALGVCTNTALVLGSIWLFYGGKTVGQSAITPEFMMGMVSINFVIEVVVFTILTPPIAYAIRKQRDKEI